MLAAIRHKITAWRFKWATRHYDAAIADARAKHHPVNHLIEAKREFVHNGLRRKAAA